MRALLVALASLAWAAGAAAGEGRCGEDPARYLCTGDSDYGSFSPGLLPLLPTGAADVQLHASFEAVPLGEAGSCQRVILWSREPIVRGPQIDLQARRAGVVCLGPGEAGSSRHELTWDLGRLEPRVYAVALRDVTSQRKSAAFSFEVRPVTASLSLRDGFVASVVYGGADLPAAAVKLTSESSYFAFQSPGNVELTLKILDGRALNGHHWVFLASMTDQPFTLTVFDNRGGCLSLPGDPRQNCAHRDYVGAAGQNRNVIDTAAFPKPAP